MDRNGIAKGVEELELVFNIQDVHLSFRFII